MSHKLNYQFDHSRTRFAVPYKALLGGLRKSLPSVVDLRQSGFMPPVENQGDEGDCAAHSTAGALEFLQLMGLKSNKPSSLNYGSAFERVSRQQLYWCGRSIEGSTDQDSGIADLADMAKVAANIGVAREALWPYVTDGLFNPPPKAVMDNAAAHKLAEWYALDVGYQIKHCLWAGYPVMMGFSVPAAFMDNQMATTGEMPSTDWMSGDSVGGHAVLIVGYDDARQCHIVRNSWGGDWGIDGYFHVPNEFLDSEFCGDFITLRIYQTLNP